MSIERRDTQRRANVLRLTTDRIIRGTQTAVTVGSAAELLSVPEHAAERIIARLVCSGVLTETRRGVWGRALAQPSSRHHD